jgi:hypothetical protein
VVLFRAGARIVYCAALALLVLGAAEANVAGDSMRHLLEHRYLEEGEVAQRVQSLKSMPPLVTPESIEEAKRMHMGNPIAGHQPQLASGMRTKHGVMLAGGERPSAFAGIPAYVFVLVFLGSVGSICVMFYLTERMWAKRQEAGQ